MLGLLREVLADEEFCNYRPSGRRDAVCGARSVCYAACCACCGACCACGWLLVLSSEQLVSSPSRTTFQAEKCEGKFSTCNTSWLSEVLSMQSICFSPPPYCLQSLPRRCCWLLASRAAWLPTGPPPCPASPDTLG